MPFEVGQTYSRRNDIHAKFGGQTQGGISTPTDQPLVFVFTGESGETYGYADGWIGDGVFRYTGEGQRGDMEFVRGNRAIRDHAADGKDLLLFWSLGKGQPVRFEGTFACAGWEQETLPDVDGAPRRAIVFHLVPLSGAPEPDTNNADFRKDVDLSSENDLAALRQRAYAAAKPVVTKSAREAHASFRQRSDAVKRYVLARAGAHCELTGRPAPFIQPNGQPYLEVHHTRRISDGGPDDPRWVAAPTVHREIHFGENGQSLNEQLMRKLRAIEGGLTRATPLEADEH